MVCPINLTDSHVQIAAVQPIEGQRIVIPPSKSITNRGIHLAALSEGTSLIKNPLMCDDTEAMIEIWKDLGATIKKTNRGLEIIGTKGRLHLKREELYTRDAGTVARFVGASLLLSQVPIKLVGSPQMSQRPMRDLFIVLEDLGAQIQYLQESNKLPAIITGNTQHITKKKIKVACQRSSQFLSALLMVAPLRKQSLEVQLMGDQVSKPYIEMTRRLMSYFGVNVEPDGVDQFLIEGKRSYKAQSLKVEGDYSTASFFMGLAAIHGRCLELQDLPAKSIQGDQEFVNILKAMGCQFSYNEDTLLISGPSQLRPIDVSLKHISDLFPILCVVCLFADGTSFLRDITHIQHKESNRIHVMLRELTRWGAHMEFSKGHVRIRGGQPLKGCLVDSHGDHRIAMSLSVGATKVPGVSIKDPGCVRKTHPNFYKSLAFALCGKHWPSLRV